MRRVFKILYIENLHRRRQMYHTTTCTTIAFFCQYICFLHFHLVQTYNGIINETNKNLYFYILI